MKKLDVRFASVLVLSLTFTAFSAGCDRTATEFFMDRVADAARDAKTSCKLLESGTNAADAKSCEQGIVAAREFIEATVPESIVKGKRDDGTESQGIMIHSVDTFRALIFPRCMGIAMEQSARGGTQNGIEACLLGAEHYTMSLVYSMCEIHWPKVLTAEPRFCPLTSDQVKSIRNHALVMKAIREPAKPYKPFKCLGHGRNCPNQ